MAERVRVQERSGRRIRPQKYPRGKSSFNLIHVCPQVRIRVTHTVTETLNSHTLRSMQYRQFRPIGFQLTDQFVFNLTLDCLQPLLRADGAALESIDFSFKLRPRGRSEVIAKSERTSTRCAR